MSRRRASTPGRRLTVLPGEGKKTSRVKQAAVFYFLLFLVAVLLVQAGYHWLGGRLLAWRLNIITAEPGIMEEGVAAGGIITRHEYAVHSPCSGVIVELFPAGERVAAGTELVTLLVISRDELLALLESGQPAPESLLKKIETALRGWFTEAEESAGDDETILVSGEIPPWYTEMVSVSNEEPGLLSYCLDGWEALGGFNYLSREQFVEAYREPLLSVEGLFVEKGQPLFKVIDNWHWYYSVVLPLNPGRTVAAQNTVTLEFTFAPGEPVDALLEECLIDASSGAVRLTYRIEEQVAGFDRVRWSEAVISFQREEGIIIPYAALLEQDSETGVFVNNGGTVAFIPVTVLKHRDGRVLVEGIAPFSMVITRPELVREGQRLD